MTTELLETIADLEAKVNELEWQLQNAEDEIDDLKSRLEAEEQVSRDSKELLLDIKLWIINAF